jgi:hypothetical protein
MKKLLVFIFFVILVTGITNPTFAQGNKAVIGQWEHKIPSAPPGYEEGILILFEKDGKLAGQIKFVNDANIKLENITYEEGILKCSFEAEYQEISISVKVEGNKMNGTCDTPDGEMTITASKIK